MVGRGSINAEIARQREIELSRQAQRRAPILSELDATTPQRTTEAVTIRLGAVGDQLELAQLANGERDSLPERPRLIAELGGRPVAALSLADGAVIAEGSRVGADVVALLRLRADQIVNHSRRHRRPSGSFLRRLRERARGPASL